MLTHPQPWAEDATIFISQALANPWRAIATTYAGYYHLIPRLATMLGMWISNFLGMGIALVPTVMNLTAILLGARCVSHICTPRFDWLAPLKWRLLAVFLVLAAPAPYEIFGTVANIQWWICYYLFLVCWDMLENDRLPSAIGLVFIALASFTTTLTIFWAGTCCLLIAKCLLKKTPLPAHILAATLLTNIGTAVQTLSAAGTSHYTVTVDAFVKMFFGSVITHLFVPNYLSRVNRLGFTPFVLTGILLFAFLLYTFRLKPKMLFIPLLFMVMLSLLCFYRGVFSENFKLPYYENECRFLFVPGAVFVTLLCCAAGAGPSRETSVARGLLALLLLSSLYTFRLSDYNNYNWFGKTLQPGRHEIKINPDWKVLYDPDACTLTQTWPRP